MTIAVGHSVACIPKTVKLAENKAPQTVFAHLIVKNLKKTALAFINFNALACPHTVAEAVPFKALFCLEGSKESNFWHEAKGFRDTPSFPFAFNAFAIHEKNSLCSGVVWGSTDWICPTNSINLPPNSWGFLN